ERTLDRREDTFEPWRERTKRRREHAPHFACDRSALPPGLVGVSARDARIRVRVRPTADRDERMRAGELRLDRLASVARPIAAHVIEGERDAVARVRRADRDGSAVISHHREDGEVVVDGAAGRATVAREADLAATDADPSRPPISERLAPNADEIVLEPSRVAIDAFEMIRGDGLAEDRR